MTNFRIEFTGQFTEDDPAVAIGEIQLGDHSEIFHAVVGYWSIENYKNSWTTALRRLVAGAPLSCLLASVTDPDQSEFVTAWPLYRSGNEVYVQNQLIFLDELDHDFDPDAPWASIPPHSTTDEDGNEISEWQLSLSDIQEFLATQNPTHAL